MNAHPGSATSSPRESPHRYNARVAIFYEWYSIERQTGGRETRRQLRWRMTAPDAIEWAERNPGKILEMVPGSGEDRGERTLPYVGWGQAGLDAKAPVMVGAPPKKR